MNVASFYRFLDLEDPAGFRDELQAVCDEQGLLGTILVATEGFNGSVAGDEAAIRALFAWIEGLPAQLAAQVPERDPLRRLQAWIVEHALPHGASAADDQAEDALQSMISHHLKS